LYYYQRRGDIRRLYDFFYPAGIPHERFLLRKRTHFVKALEFMGA